MIINAFDIYFIAKIPRLFKCSTFHTFPYPPSPITSRKLKSSLLNFSSFSCPSLVTSVIEMSRYDFLSDWYTLITLAKDYLTYSLTFFVDARDSLSVFLLKYSFFFLSCETFFNWIEWRSARLDLGDALILWIRHFEELPIELNSPTGTEPAEVLR